MDIISKIRKQKAEIQRITDDVRDVQREINQVSDKLRRTTLIAEELMYVPHFLPPKLHLNMKFPVIHPSVSFLSSLNPSQWAAPQQLAGIALWIVTSIFSELCRIGAGTRKQRKIRRKNKPIWSRSSCSPPCEAFLTSSFDLYRYDAWSCRPCHPATLPPATRHPPPCHAPRRTSVLTAMHRSGPREY